MHCLPRSSHHNTTEPHTPRTFALCVSFLSEKLVLLGWVGVQAQNALLPSFFRCAKSLMRLVKTVRRALLGLIKICPISHSGCSGCHSYLWRICGALMLTFYKAESPRNGPCLKHSNDLNSHPSRASSLCFEPRSTGVFLRNSTSIISGGLFENFCACFYLETKRRGARGGAAVHRTH